MPCHRLLCDHIGCYLQEIASVVGKGNGFAVVGTHALGVGLQRALGAHLPCAALTCAHRTTSMHLMVCLR
jgi:hypothetical protein